jgi:formate dehydrogenase maturation protein FdhE
MMSSLSGASAAGRSAEGAGGAAWACPTCGQELPALTVKKDGRNKGRGFLACKDCDNFFWLDTDYLSCPACVTLCPVLTVKRQDSPNLGRRFLSCRCGKFSWVRERGAAYPID